MKLQTKNILKVVSVIYISSFWSHMMFSVRNRFKVLITNNSLDIDKNIQRTIRRVIFGCFTGPMRTWISIWIGLDRTFYLRVKLVCIDDAWTLYHHSAKKQSEYFNGLPGKYYRAFYWNIKKYIKILFRVSPFLCKSVYVNEWWDVMLSTNDTEITINIPAILIVFISGVPRVITIRMCCSFVFLS